MKRRSFLRGILASMMMPMASALCVPKLEGVLIHTPMEFTGLPMRYGGAVFYMDWRATVKLEDEVFKGFPIKIDEDFET